MEERRRWVLAWSSDFAMARESYERGEMSAPELCAFLIDRVWRDLFPRSWRNGQSQEFGCVESSDLLTQFVGQRYRGLPSAVPRSLAAWSQGRYPLSLHFRSLSVEEVLSLQAAGQRCVSLMITPNEILHFEHEGRDFISFLIHDLIHSDHLMSQLTSYRRQALFSRWMAEIWKDKALWMSSLTPEQGERLEYIAADMNSHLVHLLKTLKALFSEISQQVSPGESHHSSSIEAAGRTAWHRLFPEATGFVSIWNKLNTPDEDRDLHCRLVGLWDHLDSRGPSDAILTQHLLQRP